MSSVVLRPGALLGVYPERQEERQGLERAASRALASIGRAVRARRSTIQSFVEAVGREGEGLSRCNAAQIGARVRGLRASLLSGELSDELAARSFALIREVADRSVGMRHFEVQLIGGWVMLNGMLAEMHTGEGKTLTATLPAATAALAGIPVHVITSNDYLAARDAELMKPVYNWLGLSVGAITSQVADPEARRAAYACDVTYCTSNQLVFDYLRDRRVLGNVRGRRSLELERLHDANARLGRLLLRGLCFAIVDEADSVLIDEARTPLILSAQQHSVDHERTCGQAVELARRLEADVHFAIDLRERDVRLSERGQTRIAELAQPLEGVWSGRRRREELARLALRALHLYERDKHYLLRDDKVEIIDQNTGRGMPDRSWEGGLHQMIEAKEGCEITSPPETLAKITYQRFFRRYLLLGGMTGTAREVSGELWSVYGLKVIRVPPHRPIRRIHLGTRIFSKTDAKWSAVVARIRELHLEGRPVLVGTCSLAASEQLSRVLNEVGLAHQLLNARQDRYEADIVAGAGQPGCITVATSMAGRGTDIRLGPGVAEIGGLHVIATERGEERRIDRQLLGRSARQGDPGSVEAILSLEDTIVVSAYPRFMLRLLRRLPFADGPMRRLIVAPSFTLVQWLTERRFARLRRDLLRQDERLGDLLAFTGHME